jgi:peptidoglycan L-alanyl-D-glutamate endopeptidase CwlK
MSVMLNTLVPEFREKVELVLADCAAQGIIMKPYFAVRSPREQAKYWRQSRTYSQINDALKNLHDWGAPYIADCLQQAGPQHGRWATNALPGLSWHNWGQAVDCFLVNLDGTPNWDGEAFGYRVYAETAREYGLTAGYFWKTRDSVHIQGPNFEVLTQTSWPEIDENMRRRFGA